ncbi:MAG: polyphosphate kinase 1 [Actinobacteria bacterium]|nr:MAG: polyphosphate kinase 1 [Actinomycetota bacterium]
MPARNDRRPTCDDARRGAVCLDDPSLYLNRELSLLRFQERVLEEVVDARNPLLERVKYLAILSSNLSEFYMVRIAALKQQVRAAVAELSADGQTPSEQLAGAREAARDLLARGRVAYRGIRRDLAAEGIHLHDYGDLDEGQLAAADRYFDKTVFPVLTPLAFDPGRPFPHISTGSLNLAVLVKTKAGEDRFARVKVPKSIPRLVEVCAPATNGSESDASAREHHFVWLEQLIAAHLAALFPGLEVVEAHPFAITRDAEFTIQEMEADDLLETIEEGVRRRRFGSVVRVTMTESMPKYLRRILIENLQVAPEDVVIMAPPLRASDLFELMKLDRPDLMYPAFVPALPAEIDELRTTDMFAVVRDHDLLLHRPYESFGPVVRMVWQAARDPDVLAIKATLYRVGRDAPIVDAMRHAAAAGKEVTALVELKARFDEESNIEWARALEAEGVHVVYGLLGLKTHSKLLLIVRKEGKRIRRYLHIGTGNYNVVTATQYTDLDLLTCDDEMAADASRVFNYLTGYAEDSRYKRFLVAPFGLRAGIEALVRREIEHAKAGRGGRMVLKFNSLVDRGMVRLLYEASQAGVEIDLLVRGMCVLRPGVPGVSENIRVTSVVGRFLEHTRIFHFENAGEPVCLIGSADLMGRNLDRRVEILAPVLDPVLVARLRDEVLSTYLADTEKCRVMHADGTYARRHVHGARAVDAQERLLEGRPVRRRSRR